LREANEAARQLHLPEKLPISEADLTEVFIAPYGFSQLPEGIVGSIHTPNYVVSWFSARNQADGFGDTACVGMFLPTATLLNMSVKDAKYIRRRPLEFTNMDYLLSQTNATLPSASRPTTR